MPLFAVTRARGTAWRNDRAPADQDEFAPHAAFMNGLFASGTVALGGWLDDTGDVLLIMRAASSAEVAERLADDPWTRLDILPIARLTAWSLGLGTLPAPGTSQAGASASSTALRS